jgi:hypothetical protein
MTEEERRSRLIDWLEIIKNDVQDLLLDQYIFRELQHTIEQNPLFNESPGLFTQWMASGFAQATAVGIRRQAKLNRDSISLSRFLNEIKHYPSLISRQYYIGLYQARKCPYWHKSRRF